MRLQRKVVTDHDMHTGIGENDHHNRAISEDVLINSQSISPGAYELRIDLGRDGFRTFWAILRGTKSVDIQGHGGVFVMAGGLSGDCHGLTVAPYGAGGYPTSYMGAYSRIHGDSFLSYPSAFGPSISLRDAYIDGDEAVLEFYNSSGFNRVLTVYGTLAVK